MTATTLTVQTFASRFQAIARSLEAAIGDAEVAKLATISIITNTPLLVEAKSTQEALANAMASVMGGNLEKTFGYNSASLVEDMSRANVFYIDGVDNVYAKGMGMVLEYLGSPAMLSRVFVLVSRINPQGVRSSAPEVILERHGLFVKAEFDAEKVTAAAKVVTIAEILEMDHFLNTGVQIPDEVLEFIVGWKHVCDIKCSGVDENGLFEYVQNAPDMQGFVALKDLSAVIAGSEGRREVSIADVHSIGEAVLAHRFRPASFSPYSRFVLGRRIVQHTLTLVKDKTTTKPQAVKATSAPAAETTTTPAEGDGTLLGDWT